MMCVFLCFCWDYSIHGNSIEFSMIKVTQNSVLVLILRQVWDINITFLVCSLTVQDYAKISGIHRKYQGLLKHALSNLMPFFVFSVGVCLCQYGWFGGMFTSTYIAV